MVLAAAAATKSAAHSASTKSAAHSTAKSTAHTTGEPACAESTAHARSTTKSATGDGAATHVPMPLESGKPMIKSVMETTMAVAAEPISAISVSIPVGHPRRIKRPAKRTVPNAVTGDESIQIPIGIPVPTRPIPICAAVYENISRRLHAGLGFILGAQIAPGIERILRGLRLRIEMGHVPGGESQFMAFLQALLAIALLDSGLPIEYLNHLRIRVEGIETLFIQPGSRSMHRNREVVVLEELRYLYNGLAAQDLNSRVR